MRTFPSSFFSSQILLLLLFFALSNQIKLNNQPSNHLQVMKFDRWAVVVAVLTALMTMHGGSGGGGAHETDLTFSK